MWIVLSVLVWIDVDLKADSGRLSLVHFSFYLTFFVYFALLRSLIVSFLIISFTVIKNEKRKQQQIDFMQS